MRTKQNIIKLVRKPWTGQMTEYMLSRQIRRWHSLHNEPRLYNIVDRSMAWSNTPQGDNYWRTIYQSLVENHE